MGSKPLPSSFRRRVAWWSAGTLAASFGALAASTYAGMRTLTDAPKGRRRPPDFRLVARFDNRPSGSTVSVSGATADVNGTWGLAHESGFALVSPTIRRALVEGELQMVRPYEMISGTLPPPGDRRAVSNRRAGDRRAGPAAPTPGDDPPPVAGDREATTVRPPHTTDSQLEQKADEGEARGLAALRRRRGDRRGRERRRLHAPPPWPVAARWSDYAFPPDPQILAARHDATFELDAVKSPSGVNLPAWRLIPPDASTTWMVAVHGRGAPRTEVFRLVDTALSQGFPCLIVSYRTDQWSRDSAPITTLGATEWEDVSSALRQLVRDGAGEIVLAGCSLGGAICAQVLRRSAMAPYVVGVILDSPALNWSHILAHIAKGRHLPTLLVAPVMAAARRRAKLDWATLDHLAAVEEFRTPILLIHGTEDEAVPVWLSDQFAAARPDLVRYLRVEGARHVEAWNTNRPAYEHAVQTFLNDTTST